MNPKNQVIKKEKLAKCYNAILMNPNQVCLSSAINFNRFASFIEKIYEEQRDSINEGFLRSALALLLCLIHSIAWSGRLLGTQKGVIRHRLYLILFQS